MLGAWCSATSSPSRVTRHTAVFVPPPSTPRNITGLLVASDAPSDGQRVDSDTLHDPVDLPRGGRVVGCAADGEGEMKPEELPTHGEDQRQLRILGVGQSRYHPGAHGAQAVAVPVATVRRLAKRACVAPVRPGG